MNFKKFLIETEADQNYHISHRAPMKDGNSPLYNVTQGTYPDDFYTLPPLTVVQYYGSHRPDDYMTVIIIRNAHNKPEAKIKIYRAVPKILTHDEKINEIEKHKAYILKTGKVPPNPIKDVLERAKRNLPNMKLSSAYFEILDEELKRLQQLPPTAEKPIEINTGDWVTISRAYAVEHGEAIHGPKNYRILTKTVKAKDLYTDANSLQEFGYDPQ
jgi:hypothetical protein